ncbi:Serine/threonine-protein phosphatase 2A regulatory subunit B'' subunit alpha [Chytriomyces hyalinus]|nr:Serine/threonine-protein phosphatase 2A regulatory subunit B'' subunit alpha [Chytriomyces hyalinus]
MKKWFKGWSSPSPSASPTPSNRASDASPDLFLEHDTDKDHHDHETDVESDPNSLLNAFAVRTRSAPLKQLFRIVTGRSGTPASDTSESRDAERDHERDSERDGAKENAFGRHAYTLDPVEIATVTPVDAHAETAMTQNDPFPSLTDDDAVISTVSIDPIQMKAIPQPEYATPHQHSLPRSRTASPSELEYKRPINPVQLRRASMPANTSYSYSESASVAASATTSFIVRTTSDFISPIATVIRRHSLMGVHPSSLPINTMPHTSSSNASYLDAALSNNTNTADDDTLVESIAIQTSPTALKRIPSSLLVSPDTRTPEEAHSKSPSPEATPLSPIHAANSVLQDVALEHNISSTESLSTAAATETATELIPDSIQEYFTRSENVSEGTDREDSASSDSVSETGVVLQDSTIDFLIPAQSFNNNAASVLEKKAAVEKVDVSPAVEVPVYVVVETETVTTTTVIENVSSIPKSEERFKQDMIVETVEIQTVEVTLDISPVGGEDVAIESIARAAEPSTSTETEQMSLPAGDSPVSRDVKSTIALDTVIPSALSISVSTLVSQSSELFSPLSDEEYKTPVAEIGPSFDQGPFARLKEAKSSQQSKIADSLEEDDEDDLVVRPPTESDIELKSDTASVQTKSDKIAAALQALNSRLTYRTLVGPAEKEKLANYVLDLARPIFYPLLSAGSVETIVSSEAPVSSQKSLALSRDEFEAVTVCCRLPRNLTYALHRKIVALNVEDGGRDDGLVSWREFEAFVEGLYRRFNPDMEALVFEILRTSKTEKVLVPEDFKIFVEDVLENNTAFAFLASSPDFQARFTETVIVRLFYSNHFHGRNRMTIRDFRTSDIYKVISDIEGATNSLGLNIPAPFSYKDFYVIYCAFWELDKDHDMYLTLHDLERYSDRGLSHAALARVIECYGKVPVIPEDAPVENDETNTVVMLAQNRIKCFGFKEFVAFIMAVEDKTSVPGLYYWFRVLDIDEDGLVSLLEIETFWEHQYAKVPEQYTVYDFFSLIIDLIRPAGSSITLLDLKRNAKAAGLFLDFLLDSRRHVENLRRSADVSFRLNDEVWVLEEDETDAVSPDDGQSDVVSMTRSVQRRVRLEGWQKFAERRYRMLSGTSTDEEDSEDV